MNNQTPSLQEVRDLRIVQEVPNFLPIVIDVRSLFLGLPLGLLFLGMIWGVWVVLP